jgi:hypothetical protein
MSIEYILENEVLNFNMSFILIYRNLKTHRNQRSKRYDQPMQFGCSSHETGLAIGYYSVLLNYYINNTET